MRPLLKLWNHLSIRRRIQFFLVLLLMFFASFAEIMSIGAVLPFLGVLTDPSKVFEAPFMQPFNNFFGLTNSTDLILPVTIFFIIATFIAGSIRLLLLYVTTRLSYGAGHDLSVDIYKKSLYQDYSIHVSRNSSEVINGIITKSSTVISGVLTPALILMSSFIIMAGIITLLSHINFSIAVSAFVGFGLLYLTVILYTRNRINANSLLIAQKSTTALKSLQEGLMGIRDVLLHDSQEFYFNLYKKADLPLRLAAGNNLFISGSPRFVMESLGMILIAVIAYYITNQSAGISDSVPILGALALGAQRLLPIMQQAYGAYSAIKGSNSSLVDVLTLLDQQIPNDLTDASRDLIKFNNHICLDNVSFRYSAKDPLILKSINLTIKKGSRIGIIGATGSGKSTLFDIINGLFLPSGGEISVDNVVINQKNIRSWRSLISYVPQDIYLSDNTVLENIAFGKALQDIHIDRAKESANQAQLGDLIEGWDQKYYTEIGEKGVRLSGGQRQRIGIARALYKKSQVLIFDEATSALDNETEKSIVSSIESLDDDLTILMIAHRLSSLKNCDEIIEVKENEINIMTYDQALEYGEL